MISYQQALEMILRVIQPLASERLPLTAAYGRIVATSLVAPYAMPPFDQSLVDGYALRSSDTRTATPAQPVRLALGQTLTAGENLHLVGRLTGYKPRWFTYFIGDAHIYENQRDAVAAMLEREPRRLPTVQITQDGRKVTDIHEFRAEHFEVCDYDPHPAISSIPVSP